MPRYLTVTKWKTQNVPRLGVVKVPECSIAGVTACLHLMGKFATDGEHILCVVNCNAVVAGNIEGQGVGVIVWEFGTGRPTGAELQAVATKLSTYGLNCNFPNGIDGGAIEAEIRQRIQGA
jgi:hypothetical protein